MAKSMRCKKEKRLRAIRRELVEPLYEKKDLAKLAAQEAALAAPKLTVRPPKSTSMEITTSTTDIIASPATTNNIMDVEMSEDNEMTKLLKPSGGIGKKSKRQFKVGKRKQRGKGKGKVRMKRHI